MKELQTKTEYTQRLKSDGIKKGKFLARIHNPKQDGVYVKVLTEHFIVTEEEVEVIGGNKEKQDVMYLIESETIEYKMAEFDKIIVDYGISYDISLGGMTGAVNYAFPLISSMLVKSGGSKELGTFGVDPSDWEEL